MRAGPHRTGLLTWRQENSGQGLLKAERDTHTHTHTHRPFTLKGGGPRCDNPAQSARLGIEDHVALGGYLPQNPFWHPHQRALICFISSRALWGLRFRPAFRPAWEPVTVAGTQTPSLGTA